MSLTGAMSNAMGGLNAAARSAQVVSTNLANAMTTGYARRSLALSGTSQYSHGGVRVDGIVRHVNPVLLSEARLADAELGNAMVKNGFYTRLESVLGTPDQTTSLTGLMASFEASLVAAAGSPNSTTHLSSIANDASQFVKALNDASSSIQSMRSEADRNIATMVDRMNELLQQTEDLNAKIASAQSQGLDTSSLLDARQAAVDEISALVPVRTVDRPNGGIALYSTSGALLLDGKAAEIEFSQTSTITPYMTQDNGQLSGLTINGIPVRTDSSNGALSGGALGAQFAIRDEQAIEAQAQLDEVARDFILRFQGDAVDPTLGAGDAGLFTDGGGFFIDGDEVGLAGRIALNELVDPNGANEVWRIRDGLGATAPGEEGDASLLNGLVDALREPIVNSSGILGTSAMSASELTSQFMSNMSTQRVRSDEALSFAATQQANLAEMLAADGVDSDYEMQQLLLVEQAYAANARVISAVDEMMQTLLRI